MCVCLLLRPAVTTVRCSIFPRTIQYVSIYSNCATGAGQRGGGVEVDGCGGRGYETHIRPALDAWDTQMT